MSLFEDLKTGRDIVISFFEGGLIMSEKYVLGLDFGSDS